MAAVRPFRHLNVYPMTTRDIERTWSGLSGRQSAGDTPEVAGPSLDAELCFRAAHHPRSKSAHRSIFAL